MGKEVLKFGDIEIESKKSLFKQICINKVDTIISYRFTYEQNGWKYFFHYKNNLKKTHTIMYNYLIERYVKNLKDAKKMSFFIMDEKLFLKYKEIQKIIQSNLEREKFDS